MDKIRNKRVNVNTNSLKDLDIEDYKTVIILDWDDTLFPTSWILKNSINLTNLFAINKYIVFFSKLDMSLHKLLTNLMKYGDVVIVTNAVEKWINISSNIIPNTKQLLNSKIPVISARDTYGQIYPDRIPLWKEYVIRDIILKSANKKVPKNIISVGDAEYEFNAIINFNNKYGKKNSYFKTIRFIPSSTFEVLLDQITVLNNGLERLIFKKSNLDLKFENLS